MSKNNVSLMPPKTEVIKRLRSRAEPITLFNESDQDRWDRLKRIEISDQETFASYRNDLRAAMKQAEEDIFSETLGSKYSDKTSFKGGYQKLSKDQINAKMQGLKESAGECGIFFI